MSAKRDFYEEQVRLIQEHAVERLIDEHYTDDAELVSFNVVVKGKSALKEYFSNYVAALGTLEVVSTDHFVETEDTIFFDATVNTDLGHARVFDAWVLRDGKIAHHFSGLYP